MGGSHYHLVHGLAGGDGAARRPGAGAADLRRAARGHPRAGLVRSCHDLSEGGLAVAVAEMAFAGGVGADLTELADADALPDEVLLFSESTTRFVVEVAAGQTRRRCEACLGGVPLTRLGQTVQGAAAAHRGGERRVGGVGDAGGPQGGVAAADALVAARAKTPPADTGKGQPFLTCWG